MARKKLLQKNAQTDDNDIPIGDIQFYDNYIPALEDGNYTITVTPSLENVPASDYDPSDLPPVQQSFTVYGPRFTLPAEDVHATFPAPNSTGAYDTILPHCVFTKRVLPWERELDVPNSGGIPWLTLLILKADEIIIPDTTQNVNQVTKTITDTVANFLKNDPNVLKPTLTTSSVEDAITCQTIQISTTTFQNIVPRLDELKYLSHCRQINTGDKEILGLKDDGWFSVALANRFPQAPATGDDASPNNYIAHLVSLEGFETYLQGGTISQDTVQLFSLANWAFSCIPDPQDNFDALMTNIINEQTGPNATPLLQLPVPQSDGSAAASAVTQQLSNGYIPLLYRTRTETTLAWYRGPFTPIAVEQLDLLPSGSTTGSNLKIYDQFYGAFNLTYSAAWQLGRSLALADTNFTQSLMAFRWQQLQASQLKAEYAQGLDRLTQGKEKNPINFFLQSLQNGLLQTEKCFAGNNPPSPATTAKFKPLSLQERYQQRRTFLKKTLLDQQVEVPTTITDWLVQTYLLNNVPFQYLVADSAAFPVETIRFFYVDPNWLNCLIDGVLSIGIHSTNDLTLNTQIKAAFQNSLLVSASNPSQQIVSGFILRSAVVSGWPGLAIRIDQDISDSTVSIVRQVRLAPNVLLCLLNGNPTNVYICEPQEQLTFGVERGTDDTFIGLRSLSGSGMGTPFDPSIQIEPVSDYYRQPTENNVLNIFGTQGNDLVTAMQTKLSLDQPLSPSEWGIQMVQAPLQAKFDIPSTFKI